MEIEHLVNMANDIGNFFLSEPDRDQAISGIVDHIRKFWDPRMKRAIIAYLAEDGSGLDGLPRAAVEKLSSEYESLRNTGDG